jgi:hypothetical protein
MIYDEKDQMEKDRNLWKFRLCVDVPDMQEDQILYDAAKVLRGSLHTVEISKDFYPSPSDLSHHRSLQFIMVKL